MADVFSKEQRSAVMRKVRSRDTKPELKVRRACHAAGFRYRLHQKSLPGSPDLSFGRYRLAVFVHGCFWHGHDCPRGSRMPQTNYDFWQRKIERSRQRDRHYQAQLRALGWRPVVIWACKLDESIDILIDILGEGRARLAQGLPPFGETYLERLEVDAEASED